MIRIQDMLSFVDRHAVAVAAEARNKAKGLIAACRSVRVEHDSV